MGLDGIEIIANERGRNLSLDPGQPEESASADPQRSAADGSTQ